MRRSRECAKGHQIFLARRTAVDLELCQCDVQGPAHPRYGGAHREAAIGRKDPAPDSSKYRQAVPEPGRRPVQAKDRLANKTSAAKEPLRSVGGSTIYPRLGGWPGPRLDRRTERRGGARPWAL